jgi:hypothetical protein
MTADYAGVCRFQIELSRTEVPWDERIEGTVVLRGGNCRRRVSLATVFPCPFCPRRWTS